MFIEKADMPVGDHFVAFLFTDIEGSTVLWERHPESMPEALERHDSILSRAIVSEGGTIFRTVGDAFHASFRSIPSALRASISAQRDIQAESWDIRNRYSRSRLRDFCRIFCCIHPKHRP